MASKRISKSAIDWTRFSKLVPESDRPMYNAFKARSDGYLRKVTNYPENPPPINWEEYKKKIANKAVVNELEKAYKATSVPYPPDKWSSSVDEEQRGTEKSTAEYIEFANGKIKEAEELLHKFKVMIPYERMTREDFSLTFPDWVTTIKEYTSPFPHSDKTPGLSKEEREAIKQEAYPPKPYRID